MSKLISKSITLLLLLTILLIPIKIEAQKLIPQNKDDYNKYKTYLENMSLSEYIDYVFNLTEEEKTQLNTFSKNLTEQEIQYIESMLGSKIEKTFQSIVSKIMGMPIIFLIISILLWLIFGRNKKIIETVEFYPPKGLNSLEIGFLYKNYIDFVDISSLLPYLAGKGYLTVKKIDNQNKEFSFKIIKLKDYDGQNPTEKEFMRTLFKKEDGQMTKEIIINESTLHKKRNTGQYTADLNKHFLPMIKRYNSKQNLNLIYNKKFMFTKTLAKIFILLSIICIIFPPIIINTNQNPFGMFILFLLGYFLLIAIFSSKANSIVFYNLTKGRPNANNIFNKLKIALIIIIVIFVPFIYIMLKALIQTPNYLLYFFIGLACIILMTLIHNALPKKTDYAIQMLGQINGFKHFLEMAEKDKLETLVKETPNYFYDIFPYAFVLGVTSTWNEKYASITNTIPAKFTNETYSIVDLGAFMAKFNENLKLK